MERKQSIRKKVLAERKLLTEEECREKSQAILHQLSEQDAFINATTVLAYVDAKNEVQTEELIRLCWKLGKEIAVPKVHGEIMHFYSISDMSQLVPGYFGIREPENCPLLESENALIVVPGVAFDRKLSRIGYGKGFYDRYLSAHPGLQTIAIAYECQLVEEIPTEGTDVPLQMLITEKQVYIHD